MTEYLDIDEQKTTTGIPQFLKVLCILTFVGAGFGILGGIYSSFMTDFTIRTMENNPLLSNNDAYLTLYKKWGLLLSLLNLLGSALCLFGALMMWKLKKSGFYMYVLGQIFPFIGLYGLMGGATPSMGFMSGFIAVSQVIGAVFPLAFIIMYGVNYKHLK